MFFRPLFRSFFRKLIVTGSEFIFRILERAGKDQDHIFSMVILLVSFCIGGFWVLLVCFSRGSRAGQRSCLVAIKHEADRGLDLPISCHVPRLLMLLFLLAFRQFSFLPDLLLLSFLITL